MADIDLAKAFVDKMKDPSTLHPDYTWDDFFKDHGVSKVHRSDFAIAAILKQARDKYGYGKGDK